MGVWARRAALMAGTNTWQDRSLRVLAGAGHTCFHQAGSVSSGGCHILFCFILCECKCMHEDLLSELLWLALVSILH